MTKGNEATNEDTIWQEWSVMYYTYRTRCSIKNKREEFFAATNGSPYFTAVALSLQVCVAAATGTPRTQGFFLYRQIKSNRKSTHTCQNKLCLIKYLQKEQETLGKTHNHSHSQIHTPFWRVACPPSSRWKIHRHPRHPTWNSKHHSVSKWFGHRLNLATINYKSSSPYSPHVDVTFTHISQHFQDHFDTAVTVSGGSRVSGSQRGYRLQHNDIKKQQKINMRGFSSLWQIHTTQG